ncbi:TrkH family potassium uptake protein [Anaplasma platys]|uniref:TrkH family potassium uptake protein n=2 Tax=Anaplasma platys TaxID=949 RepID=A0A858PZ29_9RICK|nr:TrkH family potassium uptake protein [Anaplasma platys]
MPSVEAMLSTTHGIYGLRLILLMKKSKHDFGWRAAVFFVGMFSVMLAVFLLVPLSVNLIDGHDWKSFAVADLLSLTVGLGCLVGGKKPRSFQGNDAIYLTCIVWIVLGFLSAVPFFLSSTARLGLMDAVFESMSGLTTTGATVMSELYKKSPGILLWRAMLNAMGGLGVITIGIFLLPGMRMVGLKGIYSPEAVGRKFRFGIFKTVACIVGVYLSLMVLCMLSYRVAGMSTFDAICHAFTTVSTGGFSNYDDSIKHFNNIKIEIIAMVFMLAASCPLVAYLQVLLDGKFHSSQYLSYLAVIVLSVIISTISLYSGNTAGLTVWEALRYAAFTIISLSTSTGYSNADYSGWIFISVFGVVLTICGGCSGSTNSGLKIHRLHRLFRFVFEYIRGVMSGAELVSPRNDGKRAEHQEAFVVFVFMSGILCVTCAFIALGGYDFAAVVTSVTAILSNTGIGVGEIVGPAGNFAGFSAGAKVVFCIIMLLGRLEIIPVLIFFYTVLRIGICYGRRIFKVQENA